MQQRRASALFALVKQVPVEPVVGFALFAMALGASREPLEPISLTIMLVMLIASCILPWQPWTALILAIIYFCAWIIFTVPDLVMILCGALFVYNWFKTRRTGRWLLVITYFFLSVIAWEFRDSWGDMLPNIFFSIGVIAFSSTTGAITHKRREVEERARWESEEALRSTRLLAASELHDSVAQTQALVVMSLEDLANDPRFPDALAADMSDALEMSRRAATELRAAMTALRNVDQDFESFGQGTRHSLKEQWNQALNALQDSGFEATTRFDIADDDQLPIDVEHTMSRALGELVTNLVWHGTPGACIVEITRHDNNATIRLINDIAPAPPAKSGGGGQGLLGLRERVTLLRGSCSFGARGHQWHAEVTLPLKQPGEPSR